MRGGFIRVLLCVAVLNSAGVCAQTPAQTFASTPSPAPDSTPIDPTRLGVSFQRLRVLLAQPAPAKGLKIQETIEVVGKAPDVQLWDWKTVNLTSQAVPFGPPTQKDFKRVTVPRELQTYPFDLSALARWMMEHLSKRTEE